MLNQIFFRFLLVISITWCFGVSPPPPPSSFSSPASDELSRELRLEIENRLKETPPCGLNCADLESLKVEVADNKIYLILRYHVMSPSSIPLPISPEGLNPDVIELNNSPVQLIKGNDHKVYAHLLKGIHNIKIAAPLPVSDLFTINLPMIPKHAEVIAEKHQVLGINEDGKIQNNIQFLKKGEFSENKSSQQLIAPLLRVTRDLYLGLESRVVTTIERVSPLGNPIVAEVRLLPGEEVISQDIRIQNRKAQVSLNPQEAGTSWSSRLNTAESIELSAETDGAVEVWRLKVTPLWHLNIEHSSVLQLRRSAGNGFDPVFKPWPGEKVVLKLNQPEAVNAPSFTIEASQLTIVPGIRNRDINLKITASASRGLQHPIEVPAQWTLVKSSINNDPTPISRAGKALTLPFLPGRTVVDLDFREEADFPMFFESPNVNLGSPSVNGEYKVVLPQSRWLLWTKSLGWGPVVLFWSQIAVAAVIATIFYMSHLTPLALVSWILMTIGLTQSSPLAMAIPGITFCLVGIRNRYPPHQPLAFNLFQLVLVAAIVASIFVIYQSISRGLLGVPSMYVLGNNSNSFQLNWYQDKIDALLPPISFVSLPIMIYRGVMLAWSLWLATSMIRWASWIWSSLSKDQFWKKTKAKQIAVNTSNASADLPKT